MERRLFLKCMGSASAVAAASHSELWPELLGGVQNVCAFNNGNNLSSVEARHYKKLDEGGIECRLCPRHCRITDLERGYCGVRENRKDTYYTLVYGRPCSLNIDPIEKKPLYHFRPGTKAFSLATAGCNVNCKFCQNWEISQARPEQIDSADLPPNELVKVCKERSVPTIAYTYSEPVIFYEYMYDIAQRAHEQGVSSVMITGGYIDKEPLAELCLQMDAIKVDLKSFREDYYRKIVNGELGPVLDALIQIKKAGVWLEIVYLVVPTLNDSDQEFTDLARWIKGNLGCDTPIHFSRFHPQYLLRHLPSTPLETLERAHAICKSEGLHYVYLGNVPGHAAESTYCAGCDRVLIERRGYRIVRNDLKVGRCQHCRRLLPGVF
ncbi:MAG: AmmeMemoRadiSam system radical SAM enzyme [candidate division Zixibacteria bacterium]|nr:AmmeMemoRadiSam system radical SAM enzyme [candidate division Zixibacteria bacterium]MDH3937383.1 AmmeMemoRadiSam system radical SAM enzyme [candidate division Zixibacteria bacterium]MDH4033245.1 AmmeMemoRadiSam system radical SAM enzyme [candidate division Zixibacteria bacterium]